MQSIFQITIDDYLNIIKIAKANGKVAGDDMSDEFREYIKEKRIKSSGVTELSKEEYIKELTSHNKTVLNIETSENGKSTFQIRKSLDKKD